MTLSGKVAIVTGASREIGAAMAEALAGAGAAVLLSHHGEAERAAAVVARIAAAGGRAAAYEADLAEPTAGIALVAQAVTLFGRLDIFAANAGITRWRPFLETDELLWDDVVNLNLKGSYFSAQAAARQFVAQGEGGRIVFTSSVTGLRAAGSGSVYAITKAGLRHMALTLAVELGPHGVTVNALALGATLNERNLADDPAYETHWASVIPTGRVGQPDDAAAALLFLASPGAAMITGQTLVVDGGWTLQGPQP